MITFEKLEGFLEELKKQPKETPIFIAKKNTMNQSLILSGYLSLQFKYGDDIATYIYTDNITPVQTFQGPILYQLKTVVDPETMTKIETAIKTKIEAFNTSLETEYNKAMQVFKNLGYNNIINASVE